MNKAPSVLLLEHHLKALKLPTFLRDYASVGAGCSQERADYPTYLFRLSLSRPGHVLSRHSTQRSR